MQQSTTTKKLAVIYGRVSSDEQEKEGFSIPAQMKLLREHAIREGIQIVEEYIDVETAKKAGRLGFNQMIDFLKREAKKSNRSARCQIILVEKTDRLYRNLKDFVTVDDLDVELHFVKENVVLSPDAHSSEKFMHGIKVLMAKNYVDNLSEETKKGLLEKARQGIWPLRAPIGYRTVGGPSGKKILEPNPEIAPVICRLFEQYATGNVSLDELVISARDEGLVAPRSGKPIHRAHVHKILCNRIYYGEFAWRGETFEGTHAPLVSRDLWEKVQDTLHGRGTKKPKKRKNNKVAFSGLIHCGHCGCALVGEIKKKRYVYYHCTGHRGKCPEPYVREEVLTEKFAEILRTLTFDEETLGWVTGALQDSHKDEKRCHAEAIDRLQAEHKRLQNRIETAYEDKLDGRIDGDFYDRKVNEWRNEQSRICDTLDKHGQANKSYMDEGVSLLELANQAAELFEKQAPREKRRLLDFVLSNCTWANGVLTPEFRQPFDMIADAATLSAQKKAVGVVSDDLRLLKGG